MLFRHDSSSEQLLQRLTDEDELRDGDLIEVIVAGSATVTEMRIRPHSLVVHSYRTPTFCHHCGEMLWGLVRQGLKCDGKPHPLLSHVQKRLPFNSVRKCGAKMCLPASDVKPSVYSMTPPSPSPSPSLCAGCGLDFHKRCAFLLPNDCSRARRQVSTSLSLFPPRRPHSHSLSNQAGGSLEEAPVWLVVGYGDSSPAQVPHTFHIHSYTKPTVCQHCHRLLRGLFRQGLQCSDCRFNCHRRCELLVPRDCPGERRAANGEESPAVGQSCPTDPEDDDSDLSTVETSEEETFATENPPQRARRTSSRGRP
ncbi:hypothetical protein F7725_004680 [Dissostichus mawsoni]|uniref:Phorbol-ester/DAG-type domain-containing protein n=1 Tax=Dissostichus mawsoni TaxID=36200 RepID=A0A7J5XJG1_DISMA|nr:hypothetical protein F7725_004680 [Dissostichus mawsoni]